MDHSAIYTHYPPITKNEKKKKNEIIPKTFTATTEPDIGK
jgi:hypothetical protein